jgi:uracil-DNA glycosylase
MVVGEAPGLNEERLGKPFVGKAGELAEECLAASGIPPETVFFTNLCQERPPNNELSAFCTADGLPNDIILDGLGELKRQIADVNPNLIIGFGSFPLKFLTGKGHWSKKYKSYVGITDYRGCVYEGQPITGRRKCLATYHPAGVLRDYPTKPLFKLDLRRAAREAGWPEIRRPIKHIVLDPRGPERQAWARWLTSAPGTPGPSGHLSGDFLSADIEYPGNRLVCCGFTRHSDVAVVFGVRNAEDVREIGAILCSGVPLCWQNGMFDASILHWYYDINCFPYIRHDTMYMMHAAYTEFPKTLDFTARMYTDQEQWKDRIDWNKVQTGVQKIEEVYAYNAIDTWTTHDCAEKMLADELTNPGVRWAYEFEMCLVRPLWDISRCGVRIDVPAMSALRTTVEGELRTLDAGCAILNGGREVNFKSGPQKMSFLYDKMGIPAVGGKTAGQNWKSDDDTLGKLALLPGLSNNQKQAIKMVRGGTERRDLISKFCEIELDDDGRMRCHYDPAKTNTGRLASRKFYPTGRGSNLQNIHTDVRVRAVFISDIGYVFGYADLAQAESMVVAHLSGDPKMLWLHSPEFISTGGDGHKFVAGYLFNKLMEHVTRDERYIGKRSRHSLNYHLGAQKFMTKINADAQETGVSITLAQAKLFIEKYLQLHPFLKTWWQEIILELNETRNIPNLFGRPHIFWDRPDNVVPEATAQRPQSTVGDCLNIGLARAMGAADYNYDPILEEHSKLQLYREHAAELKGRGWRPILQVHDAIGYQVPRREFDRCTQILTECMKVDIPIRRRGLEPYMIQIPVDVKAGFNWGEWDPKKPEENPKGLKPWKFGATDWASLAA